MIKIEIINSGAAFDDEARTPEIARILRELADKLDRDGTQCGIWSLHDTNGNKCGTVDMVAPDCGDHPSGKDS